jgi:hypothetical protein
VKWGGEKEMKYYWNGIIKYDEFSALSIHKLIDEYERFLNKNREKIEIGNAVIFIDNPINILKALAKKIVKWGSGYKYRSNM